MMPAPWRRLVATALGVSISSGLAAPALAVDSGVDGLAPGWVDAPPSAVYEPSAPDVAVAVHAAEPISPGPEPASPPDSSGEPVVDDGPSEHGAPRDTYTVVRGDSLWSITAHLLGPEASDDDIARTWPELYGANADVIGENPSLIHPGQVLAVPTAVTR